MGDIQPGSVLEGYEFMETIGKGGYSSVWRVRSQKFDCLFVAKVSIVNGFEIESAWQSFDSEIRALLRLNHPNIIRLYDHFRVENNFVIILEYCTNGSLEDYVKTHGAITGPLLIRVIKEICGALKYAWDRGVQHRDIKPGNIMFSESGRVKIVDFGISTIISNAHHCADFRCSKVCAAPEILNKTPHDPVKSDIWAVGVTLMWIAGGEVPWKCKDRNDMLLRIKYGQYTMPEMDGDVARIVERMVVVPPAERAFPSTEELARLGVDVDSCVSFRVQAGRPRGIGRAVSEAKFALAKSAGPEAGEGGDKMGSGDKEVPVCASQSPGVRPRVMRSRILSSQGRGLAMPVFPAAKGANAGVVSAVRTGIPVPVRMQCRASLGHGRGPIVPVPSRSQKPVESYANTPLFVEEDVVIGSAPSGTVLGMRLLEED